MKKVITLLLLVLVSLLAAQELTIDCYVDKTRIGIDDYLKFTIEISGAEANRVSAPELPEIKSFKNLGSSTSTSSSVSIINGRMQSEYTQKYTYTLAPQAIGTYIIPPVSFKYKKQSYTTASIKIEVVEGSTEPAPPVTGSFSQSRTSENLEDNLFLRAKIEKTSFYKDEAVKVDYILYTRYDIANLAFGEEPNFSGFWKEDAFIPNQINLKRENYNGVLYNSMLMKSIVLFPTQSGKMQIPSLEILVDIRIQPRSFFDFGSTKQYSIRNKPIGINVLPLPETGKPASFTNAVGSFNLASNVSATEMKVGDSFTYTLEVNGSGNLHKFDIPKLPEIQYLRFLDPEITTSIDNNKTAGKKTIKHLVIAQEKGNFTIPAISFSYFDPNQQTFVTRKTKEYSLTIGEGIGSFIPSSTAQTAVRQEGKDIGFVVRNTTLKSSSVLFESFAYWIVYILLLMLIPISLIYAGEQEKLQGNIDYLRQKQATKILKKYMKQASACHAAGNPDFYAAAQTGLSSYLADKLRLHRGSTTDHILEKLNEIKIPDQLREKIRNIFEKCNQARFMPGGFSKQNINDDYQILQEIVAGVSRLKL